MITLTHGVLPSFEQFEEKFTEKMGYKDFVITNNQYEGSYDCWELYKLITFITNNPPEGDFICDEDMGFASSILFTLGFEWV